jgi:hypothetical protein
MATSFTKRIVQFFFPGTSPDMDTFLQWGKDVETNLASNLAATEANATALTNFVSNSHTASLTAPATPKIGDTWLNLSAGGTFIWMNNGTDLAWMAQGGAGGGGSSSSSGAYSESETPPTSPSAGDRWLIPSTGQLYTRIALPSPTWVQN